MFDKKLIGLSLIVIIAASALAETHTTAAQTGAVSKSHAHPKNSFWSELAKQYGLPANAPYEAIRAAMEREEKKVMAESRKLSGESTNWAASRSARRFQNK